MRVFLGMIFGAILVVLGAYLADSVATGPSVTASPPTVEQQIERRTMVNWNVVGQNWQALKDQLRREFARISSELHRT